MGNPPRDLAKPPRKLEGDLQGSWEVNQGFGKATKGVGGGLQGSWEVHKAVLPGGVPPLHFQNTSFLRPLKFENTTFLRPYFGPIDNKIQPLLII